MCLQSHLQTSPPTPQKSYPKFRNHIFKKRPKKDLKIAPRGPGGGGANFIFFSEFLLFFFRGPCKIWEPYDNPFWKNSDGGGEKEENFRWRRWGSSLPCPHRGTLRSAPHRRHRKFFAARVCIVTFKYLPQPLRMPMQSFRTLRQL